MPTARPDRLPFSSPFPPDAPHPRNQGTSPPRNHGCCPSFLLLKITEQHLFFIRETHFFIYQNFLSCRRIEQAVSVLFMLLQMTIENVHTQYPVPMCRYPYCRLQQGPKGQTPTQESKPAKSYIRDPIVDRGKELHGKRRRRPLTFFLGA